MDVCLLWVLRVVRGLGDVLITRPEESYRLWRFVVFDPQNLENEEAKARYRAVRVQPQWVVTPGKQTTNMHLCLESALLNSRPGHPVFRIEHLHRICRCLQDDPRRPPWSILRQTSFKILVFPQFIIVLYRYTLHGVCSSITAKRYEPIHSYRPLFDATSRNGCITTANAKTCHCKGRFTHSMQCPCRSSAMPCR